MTRHAEVERRHRRMVLRQLEAWAETPMVVLSFLWLLLVIADQVWGTAFIFEVLATVIWIIFIAEFVLRFVLTPEKKSFLLRNWLTVLALALPALRMFAALRLLRLARVARGLRLVRVIGTANRSMNALRRSMRRRGLGYVVVLTILVCLIGAAGMLGLEPASEVQGGLSNYGEALWWTAMLLTSMGTDFWPRTPEGRFLCLLLAVYGFAVWGYITASIATFFIGQEARSKAGEVLGPKDLAALRREIALLRESTAGKAAP
jgi:voltage-gated potassium channel